MQDGAFDTPALLSSAQKRLTAAFINVPRQLESATDTLLCTVMCSIDGEDHMEFQFDRAVFKQIRASKHELAMNPHELNVFLVMCSHASPDKWSLSTANKVKSVLETTRIECILTECEAALKCTLAEPTAAAAWKTPAVKLSVLGSFLFPNMDLSEVHRSILGVYVQTDQRRSNALYSRVVDMPLHTMLVAQLADALASVVCPLR
tara:strand:- start:612 stop:1226 length:615 start_codon:yes stop_codon:yes gene_type:complete